MLKPLRYKVGGPSEVYASSGAAVFCAGVNPPSLKDLLRGCLMLIARNLLRLLLMGTQGHNAGCGDDNSFYSTLDRIDSGEVPIRAMAEIL